MTSKKKDCVQWQSRLDCESGPDTPTLGALPRGVFILSRVRAAVRTADENRRMDTSPTSGSVERGGRCERRMRGGEGRTKGKEAEEEGKKVREKERKKKRESVGRRRSGLLLTRRERHRGGYCRHGDAPRYHRSRRFRKCRHSHSLRREKIIGHAESERDAG